GYNWGAKKMDRVFQTFKLTILCTTIVSTLGFLLCMIFPAGIAAAFTSNQEMIDLTSHGMRIYMIAFPIVGFQIATSNFFQSIGKAKIAIFLSLSRQLLCLLPFLAIFPLFWGLDGVWASISASDLLASLLTAGVLIYYRKMWSKNYQLKV
ncbi:MAG: MATE family efflux transporter, partial [Bacteroidales bacterium]